MKHIPISEFNLYGISKFLNNLPVSVTRRGKVVAIIRAPEGERMHSTKEILMETAGEIPTNESPTSVKRSRSKKNISMKEIQKLDREIEAENDIGKPDKPEEIEEDELAPEVHLCDKCKSSVGTIEHWEDGEEYHICASCKKAASRGK